MRATKKFLEEQIIKLREDRDIAQKRCAELIRQNEKLTGDLNTINSSRDYIKERCDKSEFNLYTVAKIIAGQSSPKSKIEVIADIIPEEVQRIKDRNSCSNRRFF